VRSLTSAPEVALPKKNVRDVESWFSGLERGLNMENMNGIEHQPA
jgi:hypothetical protein